MGLETDYDADMMTRDMLEVLETENIKNKPENHYQEEARQ